VRKKTEYQKLYENLRRQIIEGKLTEGQLLPSENELKSVHKLSQPTVRKAVEMLENEGFVKKHHGKGSVVQTRPVGVGIATFSGDLFTTQDDCCEIVTTITRKAEIIKDLPVEFGFTASSPLADNGYYYFERQRSVNKQVIFYEKLCMPNSNLSRFKQLKLDNHSLYKLLCRKFEIVTTQSEQRFWATEADEAMAEKLQIQAGIPVQCLQRKFSTNRPDFYIYSYLISNTNQFYLFNTSK